MTGNNILNIYIKLPIIIDITIDNHSAFIISKVLTFNSLIPIRKI